MGNTLSIEDLRDLIENEIRDQIKTKVEDFKEELTEKLGDLKDVDIGNEMNLHTGGTNQDPNGHTLDEAINEAQYFIEDTVFGDDSLSRGVEQSVEQSLSLDLSNEDNILEGTELELSKENIQEEIKQSIEAYLSDNEAYDVGDVLDNMVLFHDQNLDNVIEDHMNSQKETYTEQDIQEAFSNAMENISDKAHEMIDVNDEQKSADAHESIDSSLENFKDKLYEIDQNTEINQEDTEQAFASAFSKTVNEMSATVGDFGKEDSKEELATTANEKLDEIIEEHNLKLDKSEDVDKEVQKAVDTFNEAKEAGAANKEGITIEEAIEDEEDNDESNEFVRATENESDQEDDKDKDSETNVEQPTEEKSESNIEQADTEVQREPASTEGAIEGSVSNESGQSADAPQQTEELSQ